MNLLKIILQPVEKLHMLSLNYALGFRLHQALLLWPLYRKADILFCTQDSIGLPIAWLKRIGIIKNKVVLVSSNLTNGLTNPRNKWILSFIKKNLSAVDLVICSSEKEQEILEAFLERKVVFLPDGIDTNYFQPQNKNMVIDIISAGRDRFRDFETLIEAVRFTNWKTTIVCSPEHLTNTPLPKNVDVLRNISSRDLRSLYAKAKIVALPMKKTNKPQGHTVLLSAMAMDKQIIASKVVGITTSYPLAKYPMITLVTPENPEELRNEIKKKLKIRKLNQSTKAFRKQISVKTYTNKLEKLLRGI